MSGKRLFIGVALMVKLDGASVTCSVPWSFGWYANENEARGEWVAHWIKEHPNFRIENISTADVTDTAVSGMGTILTEGEG